MSSVMDALQSFTKIEVFENFTCDGCKSRVNMEKQFKVEQAPEVLVIQLKRFQNLGSDISKIQEKVEYQLELDLNPFMSTPADVSTFSSLFNQIPHAPSLWLMHVCFVSAETSKLRFVWSCRTLGCSIQWSLRLFYPSVTDRLVSVR
jgi:ubiquitin carboxyl-terminal hydrolase 36/42